MMSLMCYHPYTPFAALHKSKLQQKHLLKMAKLRLNTTLYIHLV